MKTWALQLVKHEDMGLQLPKLRGRLKIDEEATKVEDEFENQIFTCAITW